MAAMKMTTMTVVITVTVAAVVASLPWILKSNAV
jgi:hypothetical protein